MSTPINGNSYTNNPQYIATEQKYDNTVATDTEINGFATEYMNAVNAGDHQAADFAMMQLKNLLGTNDNVTVTPADDGTYIVNGYDFAAEIPIEQQRKTDDLKNLVIQLAGQDAVSAADAVAAKDDDAGGVVSNDLFARCEVLFAKVSEVNSDSANEVSDDVSARVALTDQVNSYHDSLKAMGEPTDGGSLDVSSDFWSKIQSSGVAMPDDVKPSSDGTSYSLSKSDYDTLVSNMESRASTLGSDNQQQATLLNKLIEAVETAYTGQNKVQDDAFQTKRSVWS